jgi:hypothetical protein
VSEPVASAKFRTGPSAQKSVSIAPTRWTQPNGDNPASSLAERRSSSS